ncbi:penicillin-binding protein, 1A family [Spirochaeta thermophila DSM 6578]|uniref:peptidoglycan glycosyltransferase n=1 Tax=Winmispira thermophila (strain ATCC 700085 / DSM 6578 / Z-1203) TaxID=869211 RepID=G0GA17_WINT7|nr:PBP1A family penicillin-binding protein [Spirochaeta thermophila]AEJ61705.1 penicillin-binding protein, 1A family [Spirochaeta thermophila DSM 6578]
MGVQRSTLFLNVLIGVLLLWSIGTGIGVGLALAGTLNIEHFYDVGRSKVALPSKVLDVKDRLITEFFSHEKREIVSIEELPPHLIYALITREDQEFFRHNGFSVRNFFRALWNIVTGQYFSGGSTITQQVAGYLYTDRREITITRKLKELWWAFQLERNLTKKEILELYLNTMYFGAGTYGVEAASQFYFGHSARELSLAESVMLVIQLASPARYSPINHPERAKKMQWTVLQEMVRLGYATEEEAKASFDEFWRNFDYTRPQNTSAFFEREDRAPYFSEYVRQQLEERLLGTFNIYTDGFVIHTTLNLDFQEKADRYMQEGFARVNAVYRSNRSRARSKAEQEFIPVLDMLSLAFDLPEIAAGEKRRMQDAKQYAMDNLFPVLEMSTNLFDIQELATPIERENRKRQQERGRTRVEGALITLENDTGYILAMVGGSSFEQINQFNRAVQAKVQPGSSFKPLYYSAAIDSRKFTPATLIYDAPVVFWNDDGTPYTPLNYRGEWKGYVTVREALSHSMNVPSLKVLDAIGFDSAIERAALLLGISDPTEIARTFPRKYPLGLGVITVSPIQMARAYAVFASGGKEVTPLAIRYVEDRNGRIVLEPEKELREEQKRKGDAIYLISPQTAYIMTSLLQSTVEEGTLRYARQLVGGFPMPMAGKTGTTQNWSDVWTVGFSPYFTTAVWFGFDQPGNSLGVNQTGAVTAGPVWARYMKAIHEDLPAKDFPKPSRGIVEVEVTEHGLLPPPGYTGEVRTEVFLTGTEPKEFDSIVEFEQERDQILESKLFDSLLVQDTPDELPLSIGIELDPEIRNLMESLDAGPSATPGGGIAPTPQEELDLSSNPLLD